MEQNKCLFSYYGNSKSSVILPDDFEHMDNAVEGIFLNSCIRFYKDSKGDIFREAQKKYSGKEGRRVFRKLFGNMGLFDLKEGLIYLKSTRTVFDKEYNFSKGRITALTDDYMDVIEKESLDLYLSDNGFDISDEEKIIGKKQVVLIRKRIPNKPVLKRVMH